MDENKRPVSSFTSDLFGSKDPSSPAAPSSSSGIFASIFPLPSNSKVLGRESVLPEAAVGKKQDSAGEFWNTKLGVIGNNILGNEGENQSKPTKEISSFYQEERVQPCHLSSSIYYGGPDVYSHPEDNSQTSSSTTFYKDVEDDDSGSASRGNWWQGSFYY